MAQPGPTGGEPHPMEGRGWYIVGTLTALYVISFIDRFFLSVIAAPVAADLHISDPQMGLLLGAGFAVVYAIVGLPVAHIVDHCNRIPIVFLGVVIWCLATIAAAFAPDFTWLLLCRGGVAVGESVLTPAAMSMVADLFIPAKRPLPLAVYNSVGTLMKAGALVLGGLVVAWAGLVHEAGISMAPWRIALILVGMPGLAIGLILLLTVPEPARRTDALANQGGASAREFIAFLRRHWRFFLPFYVGVGMISMISYGLVTWMPTVLVRDFGVDPAAAGYRYGLASLPAALVGVFAWAEIAGWIHRRVRAGTVTALSLATAIAIGGVVAAALARTEAMLLVAVVVGSFGTSSMVVLSVVTLQMVGPANIMGRLTALNIFAASLVGLSLGPLLVAVFSEMSHGQPHALQYGLLALGLSAGPIAVVCFWICRTAYGGFNIDKPATDAPAPDPAVGRDAGALRAPK